MPLTLIVAHDDAGGVGYQGGLPWPKLPEDLKRFRDHTRGHTVIMGRKTFESIGKPLPLRENIVVSRDKFYSLEHPGIISTPELIPTLRIHHQVKKDDEIFIIGGGEIYNQTLPYATRLLLTHVHGTYPCDTFWKPDLIDWTAVSEEPWYNVHPQEHITLCTFYEYKRESPEKSL